MYNVTMKKIVSVQMLFVMLLLCGCAQNENTATQFVLDTVATITADCDTAVIGEAFAHCSQYEKILSRTVEGSDVDRLNNTDGFVKVSKDTENIVRRSLYYSDLTGGRFDITIGAISRLWDFGGGIVPDRSQIADALRSVDYHSIEIDGDGINLNGSIIDLGGIAKGYIADRVKEYLLESGAKHGIINLGGNVVVFGREYTVGIEEPFTGDIAATVKLKDKTAVTSGTYQRYIESDGTLYHHVLDPETGYGVQNGLTSVTVIGESSFDCDALSTCCLLLGLEDGIALIEKTEDTEAVFIDENGKITVTSGLSIKNKKILYK